MKVENLVGPVTVPFLISKISRVDLSTESEDFSIYEKPDTQNYCDKGGHRERSIAHAPQHREHWKKVERREW